jgi:hypothetical protein
MRISRYGEAKGGEMKLEADESFFRYRVHNNPPQKAMKTPRFLQCMFCEKCYKLNG